MKGSQHLQSEYMQEEKQVEAFKALLSKCLEIKSKDELLVIYDESLDAFLDSFGRAIESHEVSSTLLYIPRAYQKFLVQQSALRGGPDKIELPNPVVAAISASTAIVNLIDSNADNAPIRKAINHTLRPNSCRLATIPGISPAILEAILEAPTDEILSACEEMAWLLGEATNAEILTSDSLGHDYSLKLRLGGWENEPIMSPGVLLPGSWGNVPPGETFCCPPAESVNGKICINGSYRGTVLKSGEEVVLQFVDGKLTSWTSPGAQWISPAVAFFNEHEKRGRSNSDNNWNTFAELGIGLNPKIKQLTGNPLFDEKACHTLHIAIGDNSVFGDDVSSFIHEDLVMRKPSLLLNGQLVMKDGVIDRSQIEGLRENVLNQVETTVPRDAVVYLREARIGTHHGVLMRKLTKAQRVNYVRMLPRRESMALKELRDMFEAYGRVHVAGFLNKHPSFGGLQTEQLLGVLNHYAVLGFIPPSQ